MKTLFFASGQQLRSLGVVTIALLLLVGCSTNSARNFDDAILATQLGAPPLVATQLEKNQTLDLSDIAALKSLPDDVVIRHIKASRATYILNTAQIERLREMGVSPAVIDALLLTGSLREYRYCNYGSVHNHGGYRFGHLGGHRYYHGGFHGGHF